MNSHRRPWLAFGVALAAGLVGACGILTGLDGTFVEPPEGGALESGVDGHLDGAFEGRGLDSGPDRGGPLPDANDVPPSCRVPGAGRTNCGPDADESCCTSFLVEGGVFSRVYQNDGGGPTAESYPAAVSSFRLDEYEVTVGRFMQFVDAVRPTDAGPSESGWRPEPGSGKHSYLPGGGLESSQNPGTFETGWVASDDVYVSPTTAHLIPPFQSAATWPGSDPKLPINCVNWYEAYAFCIWDGGFLPSHAEWEYAAGGGDEQRQYPWGSADPGISNQYAIYGCNYPSPGGIDAPICNDISNIAPVGLATLGKGRWGQLDLAGNMFEWNFDWNGSYGFPCTNCANVDEADMYYQRMVRGGDFQYPAPVLEPTFIVNGGEAPTAREDSLGVRCARAP